MRRADDADVGRARRLLLRAIWWHGGGRAFALSLRRPWVTVTFLRRRQYAEAAGVSLRTVRQWVEKGAVLEWRPDPRRHGWIALETPVVLDVGAAWRSWLGARSLEAPWLLDALVVVTASGRLRLPAAPARRRRDGGRPARCLWRDALLVVLAHTGTPLCSATWHASPAALRRAIRRCESRVALPPARIVFTTPPRTRRNGGSHLVALPATAHRRRMTSMAAVQVPA